ncbi:MAG: tetratricopeptide repeat protein [bacterium]
MGKVTAFLALIVGLSAAEICAQPASPDPAQAHNLRGMEFYRQRQYDSAAACFRAALKENPSHKLAAYNLACALALRLSRDHSEWDVGEDSRQDPFQALERAIEIDPEAKFKAAHDGDFATVRLMPRFQMLIGADLKNPRLVEIILVGTGEWFGRICGSWCGDHLLFFETGEVQKKIATQDEKGRNVIRYVSGRYSVDDLGVITLEFPSGQVLHGQFTEDGALQFGTGWETRYLGYAIHDI